MKHHKKEQAIGVNKGSATNRQNYP